MSEAIVIGEPLVPLNCGRCGCAPDLQQGNGVFWYECRCGVSGPPGFLLADANQYWNTQQRRYQHGSLRMLRYAWASHARLATSRR